ncbi:MAG: hypothetical protein ACREN8_13000 [Candidatus Dormibacteraceae bacterium]
MKRYLTIWAACLAGITILTGCSGATNELSGGHIRHAAGSAAMVPAGASLVTVALLPGSCHVRGSGLLVLPDASCTPGAANLQVNQANIQSTICKRGWSKTIRPPRELHQ